MIPVKGGLAFFSLHALASNFHPTPIDVLGNKFPTAEHAFQYSKAIRLGDPHTAALILQAKKPSEAKLLGKGVDPTPKWDVMRHIITEKFKQHKSLRDKLLATGQDNLIKASLDSFWGAKATLTLKAIKDGTWEGANTLGKILVEVRIELKRQVDAFNMCLPNTTAKPDGPLSSHPPSAKASATQTTASHDPTVATQQTNAQPRGNVNKAGGLQAFPIFSGRGKGRGRGRGSPRNTLNNSDHMPSMKNKIRLSSSSSAGTTELYSTVTSHKKQRVHSPLSALPPPRLALSDLFTYQTTTEEMPECPFTDGEYY